MFCHAKPLAVDLRASEERFRLIVENALDYAIYITNADDRITDWLPGAEAVFGWPAAEIAGMPGSISNSPWSPNCSGAFA